MTATKSWGPTLTEKARREVDNQVAAPTEREHPPCTERISLTKECGWKDGDRGGLAEWGESHGKKKVKVCLDLNRPSHGRTYPKNCRAGVLGNETITVSIRGLPVSRSCES